MFSAQPAYNDWFISFYNVAFTSLPVIALGVFDKDVSSRVCLEVCNLLYIIWSWNQIFVALHRFISFLPSHFLPKVVSPSGAKQLAALHRWGGFEPPPGRISPPVGKNPPRCAPDSLGCVVSLARPGVTVSRPSG